ncbi:MAG: SurA N-terminal domain-containing protein, partial [Verrucomicrobia bacterium]|nr:SurA N-terminal domain-containing protein [Verrucomicrobiota bacterium]
MIGTIRKHKNWLWMIIIVATVVSFVWYFAPDTSMSPTTRRSDVYLSPMTSKPVNLFGKPISRAQFDNSYRETLLFHWSQNRRWPETDEETREYLERQTLSRVLLLERAKDMEIHVDREAAARTALRHFGLPPYTEFVNEVLRPAGMTLADVERFGEHQAQIHQLAITAGTSATLINPKEAEDLFRQHHQEAVVKLAVFWATNFMDQAKPTPEQVRAHFARWPGAYTMPARVQVKYVEFPATNYLAEADRQLNQNTNLDAILEEEYVRQGTNAFTDSNGVVMAKNDAKAKLKQTFREGLGLIEARKKASDFGTRLYEMPDPTNAANFVRIAAELNLPLNTTPLFSMDEGLDDTNFPPAFKTTALRLAPTNAVHFSPIIGPRSAFLITLETNVPSEKMPFEKVQDKVAADCKRDMAFQLARAAGTNFHRFLTNGLAQKKSFTELAAEKHVLVLDIPPFADSTESLTNLNPRVDLNRLKRSTRDLEKGRVTPFLYTVDGGEIACLVDRVPVTDAKLKAELPEFVADLRMARFNYAFNNWLNKQAELAQLVMPQREAVSTPPPPPPTQPKTRQPTPTAARPLATTPASTPTPTPPAGSPP